MPTTVTAAKRGGAERLGARVELAGTTTADRMERAEELAKASGSVLVPPVRSPRGSSPGRAPSGSRSRTICPDVETVLVPVGGGGFSAGVATAIKLLAPNARVIGVEPTGAAKLTRARAAGKPVQMASTRRDRRRAARRRDRHVTFAHHQRISTTS